MECKLFLYKKKALWNFCEVIPVYGEIPVLETRFGPNIGKMMPDLCCAVCADTETAEIQMT
jgi:hypothetical protein